jgi:hypothetical protein
MNYDSHGNGSMDGVRGQYAIVFPFYSGGELPDHLVYNENAEVIEEFDNGATLLKKGGIGISWDRDRWRDAGWGVEASFSKSGAMDLLYSIERDRSVTMSGLGLFRNDYGQSYSDWLHKVEKVVWDAFETTINTLQWDGRDIFQDNGTIEEGVESWIDAQPDWNWGGDDEPGKKFLWDKWEEYKQESSGLMAYADLEEEDEDEYYDDDDDDYDDDDDEDEDEGEDDEGLGSVDFDPAIFGA